MTYSLSPTKDIVLIKADKAKDKTESGILLKQDWKALPPFGTVEAVGPLVTAVKPGQRVLFERYGSVILEDDYRLCKESHILAIVIDGKE